MAAPYPPEFLLRNQPPLDRLATSGRFLGHRVVVSGGASGIGLACVERFLSDGADFVAIFDLDADRGEAAVQDVKAQGVAPERIAFYHVDIADGDAVQAACESFASLCGGRVTTFVHCAALFTSLSVTATTAQFEAAFRVNVLGGVHVVRSLQPWMRAAGGGAIVLLTSTAASIAQRQRWTYAATKGALAAMTKVMAVDLAKDGIRVNSLAPGYVWSPVEKAVSPDGSRAAMAYLTEPASCLGRDQLLSEVAAAILFLCSKDAGAITGAGLAVDGGYTAMGPEGKGPSV